MRLVHRVTVTANIPSSMSSGFAVALFSDFLLLPLLARVFVIIFFNAVSSTCDIQCFYDHTEAKNCGIQFTRKGVKINAARRESR